MVYTVTLNPSLDYVVQVEHLTLGKINRTEREAVYPGGKGTNVSVMLSNLGIDNRALGFTAGFTGEQMEKMLAKYGCQTDFIRLPEGMTRVNMKIHSDEESEINGRGPDITEEAAAALLAKLDRVEDGDVLVLAGSIPQTLREDMYEKIMLRLSGKAVRTVVDASNGLLLNTLKYRPFLVKPNHHELGELFGIVLRTEEEIITCATKLQELGAVNVLVSMAGEGAVLLTEDGSIYKDRPPEGTVVNSVGAGDSMVAGFLAAYLNTEDYEKAFQLGIAAGSASAFQPWIAEREDVLKLLRYPAELYGL